MRVALLLLTFGLFGPAAADRSYVFTNVNVVDPVTAKVLVGQTVVVSEGRIAEVAHAGEVSISDSLTQIDGTGRYLMPGLAEMHAHIPPTINRQTVEDTLLLYLSQGITTIRGMLGESGHVRLRQDVAEGKTVGPRIYTSGPSLNGRSVTSPAQAEQLVRQQHKNGYDHLKLHPGLSRQEFDTIARVANELELPFVGHVDPSYGALHAMQGGMTGIDHLDGFVTALLPKDAQTNGGFFGLSAIGEVDRSKIPTLVAQATQSGVWLVPTESLIDRRVGPRSADVLLDEPGMEYVDASSKANWRQQRTSIEQQIGDDRSAVDEFLALRRELIKRIHDAGGNILLGSDAPQVFNVPGFAIHDELAIYVQAGLTPAEALVTGTSNVARYLGISDERGRIASGHDADMVLLHANPLDDISNTRRIAGVMIAGNWYAEDWFASRLDDIKQRRQ